MNNTLPTSPHAQDPELGFNMLLAEFESQSGKMDPEAVIVFRQIYYSAFKHGMAAVLIIWHDDMPLEEKKGALKKLFKMVDRGRMHPLKRKADA